MRKREPEREKVRIIKRRMDTHLGREKCCSNKYGFYVEMVVTTTLLLRRCYYDDIWGENKREKERERKKGSPGLRLCTYSYA